MTMSFYIPTNQLPSGVMEVEEIIQREYSKFGFKKANVAFNKENINKQSLLDDLITVCQNDTLIAWVSFQKMLTEIDGKSYDYLVGVSFKGSIYQAAVIAYALCKYAGSLVFNDGGCLDGKEEYSSEELLEQISKHMS